MLHYYAARFFSPLLVSPLEEGGHLLVYALDDAYRDEPYEMQLDVGLYHYGSLKPRLELTHAITVSSREAA